MSHESEHDDLRDLHGDLHGDLHDALGAEVALLEIGATPVGAVMTGGAALRTRRRLTVVSGLAALAVLPVAAVAVFSGAAGAGTRTVNSGVRINGDAITTATTATTPTAPTAPAIPTVLIPSPTVTLPPQGQGLLYEQPNADDDYQVVAGGTIGGQHWRLVRDIFVAPADISPSPGQKSHLPQAQRGRAGTQTCDFTGLQWGDRPAGTLPDFNAGGGCNPAGDGDVERVASSLMGPSGIGAPTADLPLTYFTGRVDATKVASVTVTIGARITSRQPIFTVPGETDGYYVVFVPPLTFQDEQLMLITGYDAGGHVVAHQDMSRRELVSH